LGRLWPSLPLAEDPHHLDAAGLRLRFLLDGGS
jgi:hypothetical protein